MRASSTASGPRKTRRIIDAKQPSLHKPAITKDDIEVSCYRLSKTASIYGNKVVAQEMNEPFSSKYFREHQDEADDLRKPEEKLPEIESRLLDEEDETERFNLLMRQKCLRCIVYGDNSVEALRSHAAIGEQYVFTEKPRSALRHFEKARAMEEGKDVEQDVATRVSVGTAEAHLLLSAESKKELTLAANAIKPALGVEVGDYHLQFRRDMCNARILKGKGNNDASFEEYINACQSLEEMNPQLDESTAALYVEFGETGRACGRNNDAAPLFKKAYDIYISCNQKKKAERILPFTIVQEAESQNLNEEESGQEQVQTQIQEDSQEQAQEESQENEKAMIQNDNTIEEEEEYEEEGYDAEKKDEQNESNQAEKEEMNIPADEENMNGQENNNTAEQQKEENDTNQDKPSSISLGSAIIDKMKQRPDTEQINENENSKTDDPSETNN